MNRIQRYLVGTYTEPVLFGTGEILHGKGKGIHFLELDRETKELRLTGAAEGIRNPSYLAEAGNGCVYCVNELKEYEGEQGGSVTVLRWSEDKSGLKVEQMLPTHGQDPCHIAVSEEAAVAAVANFMTGSVCAYRMEKEGILTELGFVQHVGSSVHPVRQRGPHAHSGIWIRGTRQVLIPDLGLDRLMLYELTEDNEWICQERASVSCRAGSGPRYGEFDTEQRFLYIVNELDSSVTVFRYLGNATESGDCPFEPVQELSSLPDGAVASNIAADLHLSPDGKHVYVSNRGHDSIAVFAVNGRDGTLELTGHVPCGGKTPRNFAVDPSGEFVLVANQDSDRIVLFERDRDTGMLVMRNSIEAPTPVCLIPAK